MWFFLLWYTVIPLGQAGTLFNGGANLEHEWWDYGKGRVGPIPGGQLTRNKVF